MRKARLQTALLMSILLLQRRGWRYERLYMELFWSFREKLLQQNQETIVGQSSEEASTMLAERYEYYLNSDAIFHTEVIHVETDAGMGSDLRRAEPGSDGRKETQTGWKSGNRTTIKTTIKIVIKIVIKTTIKTVIKTAIITELQVSRLIWKI